MNRGGFTFVPDSGMDDSGRWRGLGARMAPRAASRRSPAQPNGQTMLPKLRIILVAMLATCAVVLALSAGVVGARGPSDIAAVPEVSRTLHAFADPDQQQLHLLAYSRRADELLRLRDLPVTPVRAVVEYAEQAQARAA